MAEQRGRRPLVLITAVLLTACGAADVAACDAAPIQREAVGETVEVVNVESFMDDDSALSGDAIAAKADLSTDATGGPVRVLDGRCRVCAEQVERRRRAR